MNFTISAKVSDHPLGHLGDVLNMAVTRNLSHYTADFLSCLRATCSQAVLICFTGIQIVPLDACHFEGNADLRELRNYANRVE